MRQMFAALTVLLVLASSSGVALAQSAPVPQPVPRLITVTGVLRPADGQALNAVESVTLSIYTDQEGGAPIWQETQSVMLDDRGRYSVQLGATHADGIPAAVFASGAQWLGTVFERPGEVEGPRVRLTSVPYALRAADADTFGGHPASDYQLVPVTGRSASGTAGSQDASIAAPADVLPGTAGAVAKYVDAANVGPSAIVENGGFVGVGTSAPLDNLHVRFTNTNGGLTGLAVQNLGNTNASYSGMLFYDQNGALGQFQGFNNVTHEYRINNIARNGASQFDGSINFMTGSTSRFLVTGVGAVGIGTTTPSGWLEVSNPIGPTLVAATTYSAISPTLGALISGRRSRGTPAAPTAALSGDTILSVSASGYGATNFGSSSADISMRASENYTDTAHGSSMNFSTTANGTTTPGTRMVIANSGNIGMGTLSPQANLEISNALVSTSPVNVILATYGSSPSNAFLLGRKARGTGAAPTQVLNGDGLMSISGRGFGTTQFGIGGGATIGMSATENYTDTAMGARIQFFTTPNGTTALTPRMTIDQNGFVGIGNTVPNGMLDIARNGTTNVFGTSYGGQGSGFKARASRGTLLAPTATQSGDELGAFTAAGYGATDFNETAGLAAFAVENWSDTAQGTAMALFATPVGSNQAQPYLAILANGNIGVSTPPDVDGFPTATDRMQVFGDIRVGTTGTNGCVKNFAGTGLIGTCSSDRRLKKNITPFAPMLDKLTALQPVHYFWRSEEFPDRHFGNAKNYGLIAQDVEQVLPELVATDSDGYKAVDYSKLPLLTIQALKELKSENDELKQEVAELKRLINEVLASSRR